MTLRFAPSRSVILPTLLAAGLVLTVPVAAFAQNAAGTAQNVADTQQSPYPGSVVEEIVARVNDQVISTSDYNKAVQDLEQQAQQHQWTEQQIFESKQNLLRDLIDQQLLLSRGKDLGITGETELVKQLDQMRKDNHLDSMDDLQKAAEAQGVSWTDFKASMRNHIIEQMVIRQEVGAHINISQSEVQAYYNAHKQDFEQPEAERLSEILVPTANPDDATQVAAAKQKADDAEAKLKGGEDFPTLAKAVSSGMTAANGGDLGEFRRGQLAKVLEDDTFGLKPGQFTEPIRTKQGYIILKVTQHTDAGLAPMKDVEPQIEDQIGMAKMQPALRDYLTKQRENAYIDIRDGYEDSGASANEMKPVYSAYTPPSKKKKRVARARFNGRGRKVNTKVVVAKNEPAKKEGIQKPGKKEKIRFGQAPRETLPPALNQPQTGTQVASNDTSTVSLGAPDTADTTDQPTVKEKKTRFSARANNPKYKRHKGPKVDPFAPPPPTTLETATRQQQGTALGLNGDTSKRKKKSVRKEGPKRRMKDEKKYEEEQQKKPAGPVAPATPAAPAVPVTPAPTGASQQ